MLISFICTFLCWSAVEQEEKFSRKRNALSTRRRKKKFVEWRKNWLKISFPNFSLCVFSSRRVSAAHFHHQEKRYEFTCTFFSALSIHFAYCNKAIRSWTCAEDDVTTVWWRCTSSLFGESFWLRLFSSSQFVPQRFEDVKKKNCKIYMSWTKKETSIHSLPLDALECGFFYAIFAHCECF